jgi:hypothetical protein
MITVDEKTIAIWHLSVENDFDYLAALYRNQSDQLMFKYLFVHACDPHIAHWYTVGPPPAGQTEQEFEDLMVGTIRFMEGELGWRADEIRMTNGDVEAFCERLLSRPYFGVHGADTNNN